MMQDRERSSPELDALVRLFYPDVKTLGNFKQLKGIELPNTERALLDHDQHMTLTVEAHHGSCVDLQVLEANETDTHYARKIVLRRQSDNEIVQFGLVRLHLQSLEAKVRDAIQCRKTPLGRILIQENVLRTLRLLGLWRIMPNKELQGFFSLPEQTPSFGRTALIYCDTVPAVELLEIVRPPSSYLDSAHPPVTQP